MAKVSNSGGIKGFFIRLWYHIVIDLIGLKWGTIEMFTKHQKMDLDSKARIVKYKKLYSKTLARIYNLTQTQNTQLFNIEIPKRNGDIAVITGGARGIGFEVVKMLLKCNMHVIIGKKTTGLLMIITINYNQ